MAMQTEARPRRTYPSLLTDSVTLILLALVLLSAIFLAWPELDLAVSRAFYDPTLGFYLGNNRWLWILRESGRLSAWFVGALALTSIAGKLMRPDRPSLIAPGLIVFLVASLAIGPGIVVNLILKNHWGRPRPYAVDVFGGNVPYVEVWKVSSFCERNCSFVSGEASTAIWLMALALIFPARWRVPALIVLGFYALAVSANRIAFGGHFASDVLLAWCVTLLVMVILYRVMVERPPAWLANKRLEEGLARFGRRLRGKAG
jgi:lipid A 4'-phosphatase